MDTPLRMRMRPSVLGPIVIVSGRLDVSTADSLVHVVRAASHVRGTTAVTLHLGAVTYMDVPGVAGLLRCRRHTYRQQIGLVITEVSAVAWAALRMCHVQRLVASRRAALHPSCLTGRLADGPSPRTRICRPPAQR